MHALLPTNIAASQRSCSRRVEYAILREAQYGEYATHSFGYIEHSPQNVRMERTRGFTGHLDQGCIRPTRIQPADRHPWHSHSGRRISHRLAFDHRGHAQLHQAKRSARHLVGVPLSLADSNVLVWTVVDVPLRSLHHRNLWDRPPLHVAADHSRWTLVRISHHSWLGNSQRESAHVRVNFMVITSTRCRYTLTTSLSRHGVESVLSFAPSRQKGKGLRSLRSWRKLRRPA